MCVLILNAIALWAKTGFDVSCRLSPEKQTKFSNLPVLILNASLPARGQYNAAGEISRKFMGLNVRKRTFAYERPVYERPVKIQIRLRIRAV